jgi:gluconolactonase
MSREVVLTGLETPEGPVLLGPGDVAFVEQVRGQVTRVTDGVASVVARGPGSPNAIALGSDGFLYAAQNGGVVNDWRSESPTAPAIERIGFDGTVATVATDASGRPLLAPNDLAFGPDGRLYVTDPSEAYAPGSPVASGRIVAFASAGGATVVEAGAVYVNGIGFLDDGSLAWVESYTRRVRALRDGEPVTLATLPPDHVPDGFAIAEDGRLYIASVFSHGISVVGPDGSYLGLIELDDRANPTNCCFDGSALWVTDFGVGFTPGGGDGRLWRIDTDATGAALHAGRVD